MSQSLVGLVQQTMAWWMTDRRISRRDLVDHLRLAIWDVVAGELGRSSVKLGPDDALPRHIAADPFAPS